MIRGKAILVVVMFLFASSFWGGGLSEAAQFTLKISHSTTPDDWMHKGWLRFGEQLKGKTAGKIEVQVFHSSQLTVDRTMLEYARDNMIQAGSAPTFIIAHMVNDPRWFFSDLPMYYGSSANLYKVTDGESFKIIAREVERKMGFKIYGIYNLGWADIGNTKRPIRKLADFDKLKIRTPEGDTWMEPVRAFGANPTPMNYGEVYTGLQQKTIDGITTIANLFVTSRFCDFTKFHTELGMLPSAHTIVLNQQFYDSLPNDLKKAVDESMADTIVWFRKASVEAEEAVYKTLADKGVQVVRMTPGFRAECRKILEPVVEKLKKKIGKDFAKLVDADLKK
jgi:TRAP-type C4-dicarboxylate transport system substrate-binding protein